MLPLQILQEKHIITLANTKTKKKHIKMAKTSPHLMENTLRTLNQQLRAQCKYMI